MTSQDDLTLLKQMYQRGEISDEQYDVLRRHVLWGTPLPQLVDEAPPAAVPAPRPGGGEPGRPTAPPGPNRRTASYQPGRHDAGSGGAAAYQPGPDGGATAYRPGRPAPYQPGAPGNERGGYPLPGGGPTLYRPRPDGGATGYRPATDHAPPADRPVGYPVGPAPAYPLPDAAAAPVGDRRRRRAEPARDEAVPDTPRRRRPRRRRSLAAAITSLLLAFALIAAGVWWFALRETGVDASTYARSVCGSVRDWQQTVDSSSGALVNSIARLEDRKAVRSAVATHYANLAGRTDALGAAVVAAGPVDVPGGKAYADSLAAAIGDQSAALRDLSGRADRLDVAAAAVFQISLQGLLTGAETAVSEVSAALARPAAGTPAELRLALSDEPACAPYVG